jgi:hypothetical protein
LAIGNLLGLRVAAPYPDSAGLEPPSDFGPVDDVPPRRDVVRAPVLVSEVVGVLPDVDPEERRLSLQER